MSAVDFLEPGKKVTPVQLKYLKKEQKRAEKDQRYHMPTDPVKRNRLSHLITISALTIELLNDCVDEMIDMKVMGAKHLIVDSQKEFLKLQEMFITSAVEKGEAAEIERIQQQKAFEEFLNSVVKLSPVQFEKLLNYSENLKNKT